MRSQQHNERTPFAPATRIAKDKRSSGRTGAANTPVQVSSGINTLGAGFETWIYETMGRKLGKYAPQMERSMVRFGDENGSKGGVDKTCRIELVMSSLPDVVATDRGITAREAFDRAIARAARATRHEMECHGFSAKPGARQSSASPAQSKGQDSTSQDSISEATESSLPISEAEPESLAVSDHYRPDVRTSLVGPGQKGQ